MDKIITPKNNTDKNIIAIDFTKLDNIEANADYVKSLSDKIKINKNNIYLKLIDEAKPINSNISFYWPGTDNDFIILSKVDYDDNSHKSYILYNGNGDLVLDSNILHNSDVGIGADRLQYLGSISIDAKKLNTNENCSYKIYGEDGFETNKKIYNNGNSSNSGNTLISWVIAIISKSGINEPYYSTREILTIGEYYDNYCILENENYKFKLNSDGTVINIGKTNPVVFYDTTPSLNVDTNSMKIKNTKALTALMYVIDKTMNLHSSPPIVYVQQGWFLVPAVYAADNNNNVIFIINSDKQYIGQIQQDGTLNMEEFTENVSLNLINNVKQS